MPNALVYALVAVVLLTGSDIVGHDETPWRWIVSVLLLALGCLAGLFAYFLALRGAR